MKFIIQSIILVILLSGCADDINEVVPEDRLDIKDFFETPADFDAALGGAFQQLQNYYASELMVAGDILTDNVIQVQTGRQSNDVYWDLRYTSNNDLGLIDEAYEAVNISNRIMESIEKLPEGNRRDEIFGQALAIRALAHFDLSRVYAQIPTQSDDANLTDGVPYIKVEDGDTGNPFAQPSRDLVQEVYADILQDLETATTLLDASNTSVENNFTEEAINGLLSRIYLYMGRYQDAIDASLLVTSSVAAASDLLDVYRDVSNSGILMKLAINQAFDNLSAGVVWSQSSASNTISEYGMDFELFQSISTEDIRRTVFVFTGSNDGIEHNAINKWIGEEGQVNGQTDMPVIRVAEVLLNRAEAQFELGREPEALATLDVLRNARYTTFTGGETGAALEAAIRFERRLEFFAEYHRFFDLKRWRMDISRSGFGDQADGTGTVPQVQFVPAGSALFQLPIPQNEIQNNPNFNQNPGYGN
ncbi:MAG: RagB/SusD family nutrient uptake outer membrane protein [Bacteroidota bacterium]